MILKQLDLLPGICPIIPPLKSLILQQKKREIFHNKEESH